MKEYEITYLVSTELSEEARVKAASTVDTAISEAGGTISQNTEHERRRLGYPIENDQQSFMRTLGASLEPAKIEELRQLITKTEGVVRVQIVQDTYKPPVAPDILDDIIQQQKTPKRATAEATPKAKPAEKKAPVTMEQVEEKIEAALDEEVK